MSVGSEVSGNRIKDREKALRLLRRFEALHPPLALSSWLMGILSPVVQIAALPVSDMREHDPFGGTITPKFVGDNDPRLAPSTAKQFPKKRFAASRSRFGCTRYR